MLVIGALVAALAVIVFLLVVLRRMQAKLQTLAVAMQYDPPAAVSHFAQVRQLPFGVVIDHTGAVARAFGGVRVTPTTVVIDKRGAVAQHSVGEISALRLQALLARLLAQA